MIRYYPRTVSPFFAYLLVICANIFFCYLLIHKKNFTTDRFQEYLFVSIILGPLMDLIIIVMMIKKKLLRNNNNNTSLQEYLV